MTTAASAAPARGRTAQGSLSIATKLFITCWVIFVLHFATDIVREHYLSFSLAEDLSFRLDKYLGLHVDIFDTPGYGAHIGNNPGVSMVAAIPYLICRPVIDLVTRVVNERRRASGQPITAEYNETRPRRVMFYRQVRERGLDVQFGLASAAIHGLFNAPLSAAAAVIVFLLLQHLGLSRRMALLFAFLYALGTPVFFRTAFLNQNLFIAHLVLLGFVSIWRPGGWPSWRASTGWLIAGLCGGMSLLSDYSGVIVLGWLGLYALVSAASERGRPVVKAALWYAAGAVGPIAMLLFYQWRSFGSPWYPGQHYMPSVEWIDIGYQGVGLPKLELFNLLLFDSRFGLFVACPLLALGIVGFVQILRSASFIPRREAFFLFGFAVAFIVFFSGVQYTRLQFVTGVRYVVPVIPALFLLTLPVLTRLPVPVSFVIIVLTFAESWCLSMVRATRIDESIAQVLLGGFQLPWMTVLAKMAPQYFPFMAAQSSPLPLLILTGVLLAGLWMYSPSKPALTGSAR